MPQVLQFEEESQVWRVPVVTNVCSKESDFVGEIHIDAQTGHLFESEDTMEILEKARQVFGQTDANLEKLASVLGMRPKLIETTEERNIT